MPEFYNIYLPTFNREGVSFTLTDIMVRIKSRGYVRVDAVIPVIAPEMNLARYDFLYAGSLKNRF